MVNLLMDFFRFVFYCFGKKPTPASKNTEKDKSPQDDIHYTFWDD